MLNTESQIQYSAILDFIYPVGSYFITESANYDTVEKVQAHFGGKWLRIKDRFLLAAGDSHSAGATGGEARHTLTVAEMPKHNHQFYQGVTTGGGTYTDNAKHLWDIASSHGGGWSQRSALFTGDDEQGVQSTGADQPHNNMPPYRAVYMYRRTS